MSNSSAARTNLTSQSVRINKYDIVGTGAFRTAYSATYIGGNRNMQDAVAKCFKPQYAVLENDFFASDFQVADRAIQYAEDWNNMCQLGKEILITRGDVMKIGNKKYLVEPVIRYFTKFTSNNGWIAHHEGWKVLAMEAFSHYTYHRSGGSLIVCDLQGRYRYNKYTTKKCRFELTDPAICSRQRNYGPTDLGEKGIETFFANHVCNKFCHWDGSRWARPRNAQYWFELGHNTSMLRSTATNLLNTRNRARFTSTLQPVYDEYDSDDYDSDDY